MKKIILLLNTMLFMVTIQAQELTQIIRGQIVDTESSIPIIGATVVVLNSNPFNGTSTDLDGYFRLSNIPVGRVSLKITSIGYEPMMLNDILITAGKEKILELKMTESLVKVEEVVVKANKNTTRAKNEMASISSKTFTIEETQRYAASADDPARMASTYAGVSNSGDDVNNDISIRGNSPKGILWRMEGIEIPNPNHFGGAGGSGGGVSMISSSTMGSSDFYTGAFPAEFGNALSGVFDINLRTGNNETQEASFKLGTLGIEASTEGPFSKKSRASYLVNYRYSTLKLLDLMIPKMFETIAVPDYQDLTFKVKVPTKKFGTYTLFGIGGISAQNHIAKSDSSAWKTKFDQLNLDSKNYLGTFGIKHNIILSNKTYLKTIANFSVENSYSNNKELINFESNYIENNLSQSKFQNYTTRLSLLLNHKFNKKHTMRFGAIGSYTNFDYFSQYVAGDSVYQSNTTDVWEDQINASGSSFFTQAYTQWKFRINTKLTLNTGFHFSHLAYNNTWAIDPRASIDYKINKQSSISLSAGLHSKPEHISTYLLSKTSASNKEYLPNKDLKFTQSAQVVLGYKQTVFKNIHLAFEPYFQYQFNVPIEKNETSSFSIVNTRDLTELIEADALINKGVGMNYGIDITVQKPLSRLYYYMLTASVYQSKYKTQTKEIYNTRYNGLFSLNLLGGKEFKVGKKKRNLIGLNGKFLLKGGNRYTDVDLVESTLANKEVLQNDKAFANQATPYYRLDLGFSYKINSKNLTHSIMVDVQNVTGNNKNILNRSYNVETQKVETNYQMGLLPFISYKLEFKAKSKQ